MATRHEITCITPDGADTDQRIDAIGGTGGGGWRMLIDEAIRRVENGELQFWTNGGGKTVDVIVAKRSNGRKYLKTVADGIEPNNLLALATCR